MFAFRFASCFARALLSLLLSILLYASKEAVAPPGGAPSRHRQVKPFLTHPGAGLAHQLQYRLPQTLLTPRISPLQYQAFIDELPKSLTRIGYSSPQVTPVQMAFTDLLKTQAIVRAQIAQDDRKQFIPILLDRRFVGPGFPFKVDAMPLDGNKYSQHGLREYVGQKGRQKVAILGTVRIPDAEIGHPAVELYGMADIVGAPKLHRYLSDRLAQSPQVHSLDQFLDLSNIAPGTPEVPRKFDAEVVEGVSEGLSEEH
ncbi:conserved hypothetical Ustilaginaceae-specific protein [Sporisorium reilianum SRZ2]|uniref:Conserved hypothetical Ustilaginaceae-specific protein n=1 Tax=Sporisorium reilianum (strain SRZ2) TaxID=999809 RepID=E6ZS68_SPORE|nr:conserved hypothetical Ustilaginaceae-specific protein [Sporisorium reilianum SRZ2]